ncbi:MAG: homoserine O-acetyltransferase [Azospirillum sp.]|nr:homoserine O-acetyltransferase [Azospirillum sp.]
MAQTAAKRRGRFGLAVVALGWGLGWCLGPAQAFDGIVEKQRFVLPSYTTEGGAVIKSVQVGWESYGTLNEARDNAILITHFFSGTSAAAGRYQADQRRPGYWDEIIGAGLAIDTDTYFVISSDTLVNLNANDSTVITTGPASLDPDTGKPYGLTFPLVTIRDFVNVQKALLDSLGITRVHAVVGASMGALQALEWAAAYPAMVPQVVAVVGGAAIGGWQIGWLDLWAAPIVADPAWNHGEYYGGNPPLAGLTQALRLVTLSARNWPNVDGDFGRRWASPGKDPRATLDGRYFVQDWLDQAAAGRAALADANHFLYLVKANQTFVAGGEANLDAALGRIKARVLLMPAEGDHIFPPETIAHQRDLLAAQGTPVEYHVIPGTLGHLNGIVNIAQGAGILKAFLDRPTP